MKLCRPIAKNVQISISWHRLHEIRHNGLYKPFIDRTVYNCFSHQSGRRGPNYIAQYVWGRPHDIHVRDKARLYAARIISSRPHHIFNTVHGASKIIRYSMNRRPPPKAVCYKSRVNKISVRK